MCPKQRRMLTRSAGADPSTGSASQRSTLARLSVLDCGSHDGRWTFLYPQGRPAGGLLLATLAPATKRWRPEDRTHPLPHANDGDATFQPFGRNCAEGGQQEATGGAVIYTVVTDTLMAASYDLLFAKSRVLGSFSAPTYLLCAPRLPARTCIK
jgi:hypothetical protein